MVDVDMKKEKCMADHDEDTKLVTVTVKRLHHEIKHDMVVETVVVRVPECVSEDSVKEFIEENEHLHPWDKLADETYAFIADDSDLYKIDVHKATSDYRPHFALGWDKERGTLTLCDEC